uniref:Uncharacterized protein n=1 Tax=Catharus ustulatus TaxID=91951 RepID=A0A8C3TZG6_CATUS
LMALLPSIHPAPGAAPCSGHSLAWLPRFPSLALPRALSPLPCGSRCLSRDWGWHRGVSGRKRQLRGSSLCSLCTGPWPGLCLKGQCWPQKRFLLPACDRGGQCQPGGHGVPWSRE